MPLVPGRSLRRFCKTQLTRCMRCRSTAGSVRSVESKKVEDPPKAGQRCPKTSHRRRKTGAVLPKIGGPNRHKAHPRQATMFRNRLRTAEDRPTLAAQTG